MGVPTWDSAKDTVASASVRVSDFHHLRTRKESQPLPKEMAGIPEEFKQHCPLWKHLQATANTKIHRRGVQGLARKRVAAAP